MQRTELSNFRVLFILTMAGLLVLSCGKKTERPAESGKSDTIAPFAELHNGGFFTMQKPRGWSVHTGGTCESFAVVARDSVSPLRQIFYFTQVGPVYLSDEQRQIDLHAEQMGGEPIEWTEMPSVMPFTPEKFIEQWPGIARTRIMRTFLPQAPRLDKLRITGSTPQHSAVVGGVSKIIRGVFEENGQVGEGLFSVTVMPLSGATGSAGGGIGGGFLIAGVTAGRDEFASMEPRLLKSLESLTINPDSVKQCLGGQQKARKILSGGPILVESATAMAEFWAKPPTQ